MKDRLASWRHSAETATIERRSKVIDGRIHDARRAEKEANETRAREGNCSRYLRLSRESERPTRPCRNFAQPRHIEQAIMRRLPPFYPRANLNNRHSSHSRRKMVCIARQGGL